MSWSIDETHDPARTSWVQGADDHPEFPIQNLPLGIFSTGGAPRGGIAIGDRILDLAALAESGLLEGEAQQAAVAASGPTLNPLLAFGAAPRRALRRAVSALLSDPAQQDAVSRCLYQAAACTLHLPAAVGDYTDFYVGIHHATNVGKVFRPDNPLLPNYKFVPIGYHGRASSVRVSGTPLVRPYGQLKAPDADVPVRAPTRRLDFELEMGVWIGAGNGLGETIPIGSAAEHVAGLSLLNDWSARDIQAWEYQPLGPFLAKNFLTTVSPWIVTAEALAPFRTAQPARPADDPAPLPYLLDAGDQAEGALAITLEVTLATQAMRVAGMAPARLSRSAATHMYWTIAQMVAHHASNGCDLRPGDLLGTGTISAPTREGLGSLLELTRAGAEPIALPTGEVRSFLEDGDELTLAGRAEAPGYRTIGFGPCTGIVMPAIAA
ncbi:MULTISPECIES: fumarylacetoacetase [Sphingomonas]|uniref:fumarylacetoacetase n=1 Tax=Sphingomonas TaxID=13687 RepID=UPI000F7E8911|nr:fumarylacetoacetase [Sphingomonas sp. ABOLF]RSV17469.1 fumarylacetoacetase [Sphingomonas sp. ABOLF]GLK19962.1 fumarylacetoacetase [Microbacterium terregens]